MADSRLPHFYFYATLVAFSFNVAGVVHAAENGKLFTGKAAMGDWTSDAPGVMRKITVQNLPFSAA